MKNAGEEFGHRGLVAPVMERNRGYYITARELAEYFKAARNLVSNDSTFKARFSSEDCETLVKEMFGDDKRIKVADALDRLRKEAITPEKKLLLRALAINSFDPISPDQTRRINPLQFYDDLNMLDRDILPQPRISGTEMFIVYTLSVDDVGLSRLHIFPKGNKVRADQAQSEHEMRAHQHPMDSSSIILAGKVTNYHYKPTISDQPVEGGLAAYEIQTKRGLDGTIDRHYVRRGFVAKPPRSSQHHYKAGDYYHLPGVVDDGFSSATGIKMRPELEQTFHTGENDELSVTYFSQRKTPYLHNDLALSPDQGPSFPLSHQATILDKEYCYTQLVAADKKIREELKDVDMVRLSSLLRATDEVSHDTFSRNLVKTREGAASAKDFLQLRKLAGDVLFTLTTVRERGEYSDKDALASAGRMYGETLKALATNVAHKRMSVHEAGKFLLGGAFKKGFREQLEIDLGSAARAQVNYDVLNPMLDEKVIKFLSEQQQGMGRSSGK